MAKVTIKGKKVKGTNKKDKITWQNKKAWQKALTVNAGAGNDIINFTKSKYNNIFYGEAGNDKITGGTGNDKIYGGKGKDTINAGKGNNTIYFNKGDGTDTILNGGGTDNLVFAKETVKTLKAKISGNNIVLTGKKGKNTVILKNYLKSGHSAQYVTIGKKKVKTETLLAVNNIISHMEKVTGTHLRDYIFSDVDHAAINALSGNDTIDVFGNNFTINPGKGDDVINILKPETDIVPGMKTIISIYKERTGALTINKGDGNDTINGIGNLDSGYRGISSLVIQGNGLVQNFHGLYYVEGSISGDNLLLNLSGGGKLTITDFMKLSHQQQDSALGFIVPELSDFPAPLEYLFRAEGGENVSIIKNKNITLAKDFTYAATVDNGLHNVNVQSSGNRLMFNGGVNNVTVSGEGNVIDFKSGTNNTVNFTGGDVSCSFENGTTNVVTVNSASEYNSFSFLGNNNEVTTSGGGYAGLHFVSIDTSRANIVNSGNYDYISNYGYTDITFTGNYRKVVEVRSTVAKTEIRGISEAKEVEIEYCEEGNASDLVFTHYHNNSANPEADGDDYITLLAKNKNGNFMNSETILWGKWENGSFDLENFSKDKLEIQYNNDGKTVTKIGLNEQKLTQYVDLAHPSIHENGELTGKIYELGTGVLSVAKDVYVQGLDTNETYNTDIKWDKKYTVNDTAGTDELVFSDDESNFRCFFDVNTDGSVGRDLYFVSVDGDNDLDSFIKNTDVNYLCVKNGINAAGDDLGEIESVKAGQNKPFDLSYFIESVVDDVAAWLTACNSANQNKYGSVMDAIQDGKGATEYAGNTLYALYSEGNSSWANYWA